MLPRTSITVSSKEMKKYAEDSIGTSDYDTMAKQYGVSKDQAKQIVRQSATLQKLYKKKVGDSSASMPTAPTEPADGNEETVSKDYADYIINLAGDEWDSSKGTWKDADGTYAKAFADDAFTADSATYKQAMTAYYTAYQQYSSQLRAPAPSGPSMLTACTPRPTSASTACLRKVCLSRRARS